MLFDKLPLLDGRQFVRVTKSVSQQVAIAKSRCKIFTVYLDKHVIYNKEEVDGFGGHDKDVKTTGGLVKTNILKLTAELERP